MPGAASIIDNERAVKKVSRAKLARGLCSQQLLSKSASAGYDMELYLFIILLERLNYNTDNLEFILTKSDHIRINTRDRIQSLILSQSFDEALTLLESSYNELTKPSPIDTMFYYRALSEISYYSNPTSDGYTIAKERILAAIHTTLPDITLDNYKDYLLSSYEWENILMYVRCICSLGDIDNASVLLKTLYQHCIDTIKDDSLLTKILPKCAYLLSTYCQDNICPNDLISYTEYAVSLLRDKGILYLMLPLVNNLVLLYTKTDKHDKAAYWEPFCKLLKELYDQYQPGIIIHSLFFQYHSSANHLDNEVIRGERAFNNLSQLDLASDVYQSSVSISRLETMKTSPRKNQYEALVNSLNLNKARFGSFVLTDSLQRLNELNLIRSTISRLRYEDLLNLINTLTPESDEESELFNTYKAIANWGQQRDFYSPPIKHLKSYIDNTYPIDAPEYLRKPFQKEMDILNPYITFIYKDTPQAAFDILSKLRTAYETSECNLKYDNKSYIAFLGSYIKYYGLILSDAELSEFFDNALRFCISCGKGHGLTGLYWGKIIRDMYLYKSPSLTAAYNSYMLAELYMNSSAEKKKQYYIKVLNSRTSTNSSEK